MKKNVPVGVSDFAKLVNKTNNYVFVDKSRLIETILNEKSEVALITRPRRWGKTLNMSMLEYFFASHVNNIPTKGMFDDLAIAKANNGAYLAHQGQHPVIFLRLKDIKENSLDCTLDAMRNLFQQLFKKYETMLLDSAQLSQSSKKMLKRYIEGDVNKANLQSGLLFLSELLHQHYHKRVYILIDEYDTPLNHAYDPDNKTGNNYFDDLTTFLKNLFSAALKDNPYLEKGILTGIFRISKDSLFSGLNNTELFSLLNDENYAPYFGFNEQEVKQLFETCELSYSKAVQQYYNGYLVNRVPLYNPWSIISCLKADGKLATYWINTAKNDLLRNSLIKAPQGVKAQLKRLISDNDYTIDTRILESVSFEEINDNETALWSMLLATGYLTLVNKELVDMAFRCQLTIPNQEIRTLYITIFSQWLIERLSLTDYYAFLGDLVAGRINSFTEKLGHYLLVHGSYHDYPQESNYHTFIIGLICGLAENYMIVSNSESGLGRPDIILIPKHNNQQCAIIIELKRHKESTQISKALAADALAQIDRNMYQASLKQYQPINKVLKIGLAFSGKAVASCYRWDDLNNQAISELVHQQTAKKDTNERS